MEGAFKCRKDWLPNAKPMESAPYCFCNTNLYIRPAGGQQDLPHTPSSLLPSLTYHAAVVGYCTPLSLAGEDKSRGTGLASWCSIRSWT